MTLSPSDKKTVEEAKARAAAATEGPWHHCQAFETVGEERTIHGRVPAQRVDYVSTWAGPGTPKGHRVVIPMEGRECHVSSNDMAFIAHARTDIPALIEIIERLEATSGSFERSNAYLLGRLEETATERDKLREALETIQQTYEDEIQARYTKRGLTEEQATRFRVFHLLVMARNLARQALSTKPGSAA